MVKAGKSPSGSGSFTDTLQGSVMGTPQYMSPEQAMGLIAELDARSDIFSLGGVLYSILTLRPPVEGTTLDEVLQKVANADIASPTVYGKTTKGAPPKVKGLVPKASDIKPLPHLPGGRVPPALSAVAMKALALKKGLRYQNVTSFGEDIRKYQTGFATSAEKIGFAGQLMLMVRRNKAASIGTAAVLLVGLTLGTKAVIEGRRAEVEGLRATKALRDLKKTAPDLLRLAISDSNFQDFPAARKNLDATLLLDPDLKEVHWQRAWIFLGMEDYKGAANALKKAGEIDPGRTERMRILPYVESLASLPPEERNDASGKFTAICSVLREAGAHGPAAVMINHMRRDNQERIGFVQEQLEARLGKGNFTALVTPAGYIQVEIPPASDLSNVRGLPIDNLTAHYATVKSFEFFRGMRLNMLLISQSKITDLSPLAGMSLTQFVIHDTKVADLTPLAGMPLRFFGANRSRIRDMEPLRGAPLEKLQIIATKVDDLSPLAGAPLKSIEIADTKVASFAFLKDSPIESVVANGTGPLSDISALKSCRQLFRLLIDNTAVADLSPLRGSKIRELSIANCRAIKDFTALLEMPELESLGCDGLPAAIPVLRRHPNIQFIEYRIPGESGGVKKRKTAEFWAAYDALHPDKK